MGYPPLLGVKIPTHKQTTHVSLAPGEMILKSSQAMVEGHSRKCFKEITSSLRGWKKKFFLIDRRAIPKAMPWRHANSDLRDDFPTNYQERDAARLSAVTVRLRPPPWLITMDDFLSLAGWTGVVVSRGDPITKKQRPKKHVIEPLKVGVAIPGLSPRQKNFESQIRKCLEGVVNKKRARKDPEPHGSGSVGTHLPATPCIPSPRPLLSILLMLLKTLMSANVVDGASVFTEPQRRVSVTASAGKKINDLSNETRLVHPSGSTDGEDSRADGSEFRFVPDWGLWDDLQISRIELVKSPSFILLLMLRENSFEACLTLMWRGFGFWRAAGVAKEDMVRQRLIREFVPDVVRKLHMSVEYRQSVAVLVSLCFTVRWLSGLSLGRTPDYIEGFNFPE
uniref:Uncharacterized protein n=1 Tax=Tanacetum cinerariifolium TaxID=118510 RepID=A0A6L2L7Z0_TANCI|nr:hypothetical protein [Tanacetum cinerariifolium]GEU97775.1 hypothetical protein [Tanacetum cinerariifolium]